MAPTDKQDAKITLYWLNKSRSHRILWLLEELDLKYDIQVFHRQPNMLAPPELENIHPLGKSPVLGIQKEGQVEPLILAESGLIVEYLLEHYGPQYIPQRYKAGQDGQVCGETEAFMRYRWLMHYTEGSFMYYLVSTLLSAGIRRQTPWFMKPIGNAIAGKIDEYLAPQIGRQLAYLETLAASPPEGGPWLCGAHLSGADIMLSFPMQGARWGKWLNEKDHPKLWAFVDRVEVAESFKRAAKKIEDVDGKFDGLF